MFRVLQQQPSNSSLNELNGIKEEEFKKDESIKSKLNYDKLKLESNYSITSKDENKKNEVVDGQGGKQGKNKKKTGAVKIKSLFSFFANKKYITSLQFTLNESHLLLGSIDNTVKLYTLDGKIVRTFSNHTDIVSSVKVIDSTNLFISGGIDKKIVLQDISNEKRNFIYSEKIRIRELHLCKLKDSSSLFIDKKPKDVLIVIPASKNEILFYSFTIINLEKEGSTLKLELVLMKSINEVDPIISTNISSITHSTTINSNYYNEFFIVNTSKIHASINLYSLSSFELLNKYYGHIQTQFVIKCCIGGKNNDYIFSGSEDSKIYIWHRRSSIHLFCLSGHTGPVNSLTILLYSSATSCLDGLYSNSNEYLFSVSDDHTIKVWSNREVSFKDSCLMTRQRINSTNSLYLPTSLETLNNNNTLDERNSHAENSFTDLIDDEDNYAMIDQNNLILEEDSIEEEEENEDYSDEEDEEE